MNTHTLRHVLLIAKREYLERVRTKAFLIMTLLTPAIIAAWAVVPSMIFGAKTSGHRNVVIATTHADLGSAIRQRLENPPAPTEEQAEEQKKQEQQTGKRNSNPLGGNDITYSVSVSNDLSDAGRKQLQGEVNSHQIDGFLWLDDAAVASRKAEYTTSQTSDFIEFNQFQDSVRKALLDQQLRARGFTDAEITQTFKPYKLDLIAWKNGHAAAAGENIQFFAVLILGLAMYMVVIIYGMGVMRSVIQEKTSRIMEVLLAQVTTAELMAGKIIGVGLVGITQIAIWTAMGAFLSAPGAFSMGAMIQKANLSLSTGVYFGVFFILGYFLYASMCAALGAMVNSEQEAQQLQFFVLLPLILSFFTMFLAMRAPNDIRVVVASYIPFATPLVMYARIIVQAPAFSHILASILGMIACIVVVVWICARIYRVGVLMYGKRPTLPEIIRWVRYA
jgi:ABC-2 type transport system permease protein